MLEIFLLILEEEGEKKRFQDLYELYLYKLLFIARRILRDEKLAEDAVQDTFLYLAMNFHKVDEEFQSPRFRRYIYLTVKHRALNIIRKRKMEISVIEDSIIYEIGSYDHVENLVITNEEYKRALTAILNLAPKYRECLEFYVAYELTIKEIAILLGEKYETIKKRIERGKKLLRKSLSDER